MLDPRGEKPWLVDGNGNPAQEKMRPKKTPREKHFLVAKSPITKEYFAGWMTNEGEGICCR